MPQYLSFTLAGEQFAVGILRVKEILEFAAVTRVPRTPRWIRGVFNLRGSVVPVVDLAVQLGLPASVVTRRACLVIVEVGSEPSPVIMALLVDAVSQVMDLAPEQIEPTPAFGTAVRVDYLVGMGKLGQRFVLILDIDRVLSTTETVAVAELQAAIA